MKSIPMNNTMSLVVIAEMLTIQHLNTQDQAKNRKENLNQPRR